MNERYRFYCYILTFLILFPSSKTQMQNLTTCWTSSEICYDPNLSLKPEDVFEWDVWWYEHMSITGLRSFSGILSVKILNPIVGLSYSSLYNNQELYLKVNSSGTNVGNVNIGGFSDFYIAPTVEIRENEITNYYRNLVEENPFELTSTQGIFQNNPNITLEGSTNRYIKGDVYYEAHNLTETDPESLKVFYQQVIEKRDLTTGILLNFDKKVWTNEQIVHAITVTLAGYGERKQTLLSLELTKLSLYTFFMFAIISSIMVIVYLRSRNRIN